MTETKLQQQCVRWFKYQYPGVIIASFPNEGKRSKFTAQRMKAEGLCRGIPDLIIFGIFGAPMLIEMKIDKAPVRPDQVGVHETLREAGYQVRVCRTFEDFKYTVDTYMENS